MTPILRVGFMAFIAYWGMIEIFLKRTSFIRARSAIGNSCPSNITRPAMCFIGGTKIRLWPKVVFPQPDSPARPMISPSATEGGILQRAHIARQGLVVDGEILNP